MAAALPVSTFRVHLSTLIAGRMDRKSVDVLATDANAARVQVLALAAYSSAIILKIKKVRQ